MSTLTDKVIGKRLRQYRDEIGFTQEELAHGIGTTRSVISNYELGHSSIKLSEAKKISDYLGISFEEWTSVDESEFDSLILFRNGDQDSVSNEELLDRSDLIIKELFAQLELCTVS
ncbi:helix-turn-helix transcriptional regulator [Paenibacillus sp. FSL H8-0104]|uniref:helix-turn-helix domain-containing protein n=1 Tax=Paenibacillus sp. FSL H8-0104 TaxID=2954509 RepID=UPI0030FD57E7